MFSGQNSWQDANPGYQISSEDLQTLVQLAGKYGPINLMFFLRSIGETSTFRPHPLDRGVLSRAWDTS